MVVFYTNTEETKQNCIREIQNISGEWQISIKKAKRSNAQNSYFHALVGVLSKHTGHSPEDLKDIIKAEVLGFREIEWRGKNYNMPVSSSSLDKAQYAELIGKVIEISHKMNLVIPAPSYYGYKDV